MISNKILNLIENMTLLEINNLINCLEKKYNINNFDNKNSDLNDNKNINNEDQNNYSLYLNSFGKNKVSVIKIIKEENNLGLKDAKELVESSPVVIKKNLNFESANILKEKLEKVGAISEIKKNE